MAEKKAEEKRIIVIGRGPAGISAAIYAVRAGIATTVIAKDGGALAKTDEIENYFGFPDVVSGSQLLQNGRRQAERLGVEMVEGEVVNLGFNGRLTVKTPDAEREADAVIIATGVSRQVPPIPGLAEYEGKGVSYCAVCDAFFYRGRDVAVLGSHDFAVHEAMELLPVASSVTMLTNGDEPAAHLPKGLQVDRRPITGFTGDGVLDTVTFSDGGSLTVAGVFVALGVAGSSALARKVGAATENNRIVVDENMATTVPGLFAAGDCTGGLLQVAKAVYEGAKAGTEAVKHVRSCALD